MKKLEREELIKRMIELENIERPERERVEQAFKNEHIDAKVFRLDLWQKKEFDVMIEFKYIESKDLKTMESLGYRLDKIYTFNSKKHSYLDLDGVKRYYMTAIFKKPYDSFIEELAQALNGKEPAPEQQEQQRQEELNKIDLNDYSQERA